MKQYITITFVLLSIVSFGQKEANWWFFGTAGGVNFNCSPPIAVRGIAPRLEEGIASISDSYGNYLFSTNGDTIWDKNFQVMPNGYGLSAKCDSVPDSVTQPALIVPKPGSTTLYYVFTTNCVEDTLASGFRYSIVDMNLNNGNGDVSIKNQFLFAHSCEKVTATKYNDGYWIVAHEFGTNNFYSYYLSDTGLTAPVISSTGQIHSYMPTNSHLPIPEQAARGYLKFSPDGNKLVALVMPDDYPYDALPYVIHPEVFSFDKNTGIVQSQYIINHADSVGYYGASFSPDGTKLYLAGAWGGGYLVQFNLSAGSPSAIINSRVLLNEDTVFGYHTNAGALQLATDGKIYVATGNSWLDVINNPNALGTACNFQTEALPLHDCPELTFVNWGLPNFIESYFETVTPGYSCQDYINADFSVSDDDCVGSLVYFYDSSTMSPSTINFWQWNFGDSASGAANISNLQNPSHQFSSGGTFIVQLIAMSDTAAVCKSDTITHTVKIQVCTGINPTNNHVPVILFPNPTTDNVQIAAEEQLIGKELSIRDISGRLLLQRIVDAPLFTIPLTDLANGVYLIQIDGTTKKLVKE